VQLKADSGTPTEVFVLMWVVAALFLLIWPVRIWMRVNLNRSIDFVTVHKICVFKHGYDVTAEDCERVVDDMLAKWPNVFEGEAEHSYTRAYNALAEDYSYVSFEEGPYLDHERMKDAKIKFAGLTSGRTSRVAFEKSDLPVEKTAFAHEVGHIVYALLVGDWWTKQQFHDFSKKYRLGV
jgi:hypothetical protein